MLTTSPIIIAKPPYSRFGPKPRRLQHCYFNCFRLKLAPVCWKAVEFAIVAITGEGLREGVAEVACLGMAIAEVGVWRFVRVALWVLRFDRERLVEFE